MRVSYIGKKWVITTGRELAIRDINNNMIMFDTQQQAEDYLDKIKKCKYYSTDYMLGGMCKRCSSFKQAMPEIAFCAGMCEHYEKFDPLDTLNKFQMFQGTRAGRELWGDKPLEVQNDDLKNFNRDIDKLKDCLIVDIDIQRMRGALVGDGYLQEEVDSFDDERIKQIWADRFKLEIVKRYNQSKSIGLI